MSIWDLLNINMSLQAKQQKVFALRAHYDRLDVLGISSIRDEEVDHPDGFDQQVTAQEEDAKDHGEREDAHHGDLHQVWGEGAVLVRTTRIQSGVCHSWGPSAACGESLSAPGVETDVRVVQRCPVHPGFASLHKAKKGKVVGFCFSSLETYQGLVQLVLQSSCV